MIELLGGALRFLWDCLWNKQTLGTLIANIASALAALGMAASTVPKVHDVLVALIPPDWLPATASVVAVCMYLSGAASGRKTAPEPSAAVTPEPPTPTEVSA